MSKTCRDTRMTSQLTLHKEHQENFALTLNACLIFFNLNLRSIL